MSWSAILSLLLAALLLFVCLAFLLRIRRALLASRAATHFRQQVAAVVAALEPALTRLAERADAARRGRLPLDDLEVDLLAVADLLEGAHGDLLRVAAPPNAVAIRGALAADVERAERAIVALRDGCQLARTGGRGHGLEAQTAIKRGYLDLVHTHEALAGHAAQAAGVMADRTWWRTSRI